MCVGNMASDRIRIRIRDVGKKKAPARVILRAQFFDD